MGRTLSWVSVLGLLGLFGATGAGCSTRALCESACDVWTDCGMWDYDTCMVECRIEGNWSSGYVNCLEAQDPCDESALDSCDLP